MTSPFTLDVASALRRVRERDPLIHAFVTLRLEEAAAEAARRAAERPRSEIHGVPYGLKDEWDTAGLRTTGGSWRHRDRTPSVSNPVHEVFEAAGAVLVGKTNLSDLGLPPEATSYVGGATRNPWDLRRTAGGSSGGAAAAVADGQVAFDWGTDIGGSIRLPAAFCGVFGLKLSSETWPITGLFPNLPASLAWLCGQGPITRTTEQARALLAVTAPRLRRGAPRPFAFHGLSLLVPDHLGAWPGFAEEMAPLIDRAGLGPVGGRAPLPGTTEMREIYGGVWASHLDDCLTADPTLTLGEGLRATLSALLLRGVTGDRRLHPTAAELLLLIALGRYTVFRDRRPILARAQKVRSAFDAEWERGRIVVAPVCSYPPPLVGRSNWNPWLLSSTIPGNLADATGLAIPFGYFKGPLPRAIQLLGPPGSEELLLELADRILAARDANPAVRERPCPERRA